MGKSLVYNIDYLIDDVDIPLICGFKWYKTPSGYVRAHRFQCGVYAETVTLQRLIMHPTAHQIVDHKNGNKLDNRRSNLRITDQSHNAINSKIYSTNTTGIRGVYFYEKRASPKKWFAKIMVNGRSLHLGHFLTKQEAEYAREKAEVEIFGEFSPKSGAETSEEALFKVVVV